MKQIINDLAETFGVSKQVTDKLIREFLREVQARTVADGRMQTPFGTFKLKECKATVRKNPKTGEDVDVPAKKTIKFVVGSGIKREINE